MADINGLAPPSTPEGWAKGNAPGFFNRVQTPISRSVRRLMEENRQLKEAIEQIAQRLSRLE